MPEAHLHLAEKLMRTCFELYNRTETGLSPELVYFNLGNNDRNDFYIKVSTLIFREPARPTPVMYFPVNVSWKGYMGSLLKGSLAIEFLHISVLRT